jgi:Restriction endonuclease
MASGERASSIGSKRIAAGAYDALIEALAVVFWNKVPFERFLRMSLRDHPELLSGLTFSATKRDVAAQLVTVMAQKEGRYQAATVALMLEIAAMDEFPNLERHEDRDTLVANAKAAVAALRKWTTQYSAIVQAQEQLEREQQESQSQYQARRSHARVLEELKQQFLAMYGAADAQARGRAFERLLNELFFLYDLNPRKSFSISNEQIDGAFTFNTDDYLLEAKWEQQRTAREDVDVLAAKVRRKGPNAMGLFVSVAGFSDQAINAHTDGGYGVIFMDGTDLFSVLEGRPEFTDVLDAKRRHLNETGNPLLFVKDILGH